jgi:hypothetical protein
VQKLLRLRFPYARGVTEIHLILRLSRPEADPRSTSLARGGTHHGSRNATARSDQIEGTTIPASILRSRSSQQKKSTEKSRWEKTVCVRRVDHLRAVRGVGVEGEEPAARSRAGRGRATGQEKGKQQHGFGEGEEVGSQRGEATASLRLGLLRHSGWLLGPGVSTRKRMAKWQTRTTGRPGPASPKKAWHGTARPDHVVPAHGHRCLALC